MDLERLLRGGGTGRVLAHHASSLVPFDVADLVYAGPAERIGRIGWRPDTTALGDPATLLPTESLMFGAPYAADLALRSSVARLADGGVRAAVLAQVAGGPAEVSSLAAAADHLWVLARDFDLAGGGAADGDLFVEDLFRPSAHARPYREANTMIVGGAALAAIREGRLAFVSAAGEALTRLLLERRGGWDEPAAPGAAMIRRLLEAHAAPARFALTAAEAAAVIAAMDDDDVWALFDGVIQQVAIYGDDARMLYWLHMAAAFGLDDYGLARLRVHAPQLAAQLEGRVARDRQGGQAYLDAARAGGVSASG